ncbi:hypothetical protein SDC9_81904 [bioreactor metagenome]|uniref:Lipoprotein n=1 Tax=bioreactor metagenome TaxID=1076179 RepID=A0A644ZBP4_9ZZZZ
MKKINTLFLFLLSIILLSGCKGLTKSKESAFLDIYQGIEFNNDMILAEDPLAPNNGYLGSEIDLVLQNKSTNEISIELSKDIQLFTYSDKQKKWIKLTNKFTYSPGGAIIYSEEENKISNALVLVWPEVYDFNTSISVRVVVIGHSKQIGGTLKDIGAYYDTNLIPLD